jgi:hypothetical protein
MATLTIYRELGDPSPGLIEWLQARDQLFPVVDDKGKERYYVENDTPRPQDISEEIVGSDPSFPGTTPHAGCTVGFALFDDDGTKVGTYRSLDRAEKAAARARVVVVSEVDVESDPEWDSIDGTGAEDSEDDGGN